ncbi:graves disease carrier protein homolog [Nematostella vectensis]|uniref:graves disease carrier protein homolog n=1 Tax=Nematostella vectensis TaxID=45351 RepID=UPI00207797C3|nr:graves disease carrier protein homolog [Nematostella vectensis]
MVDYKTINTFVAGGLSTCCAKTTTAPLERLKILFQAQNKHYKNMSVFGALKAIYKKEGLQGYYKGNGAMMVRVFPYGSIQFVSYEQYKLLFENALQNSHLSKIVAGGLAGLTACSCTYPLDIVRSRLAFQVADEHTYCGICQTVKQIFMTEGGMVALYRGFTPTSLSMIPAVGIGFYAFESFKDFFVAMKGVLTRIHPETGETVLTASGGLLCGALAGATSQTLAYPLDVVRRRMQLAGAVADGHKYSTCINTFISVYTEDGIRRGLYRGLSINYLRVCPQVAVMFAVYEVVKQLLTKAEE